MTTTAHLLLNIHGHHAAKEMKEACDLADWTSKHRVLFVDPQERFIFRDGSILTITNHGTFGMGFEHCFCLKHTGHQADCRELKGERGTEADEFQSGASEG